MDFEFEEVDVDPVLKAAIAEHRMQINKSIREPGRTSTFFMFHTSRLDEKYRDMWDGPRIGFTAETLARLLFLFPAWDATEKALRWMDLKGSSRLVPVGLFTDEQVFDEASQRIYSVRLQIEFGGGVAVPKRDPIAGGQMRPHGAEITSHSIHRSSIESWRSAEQFTIERSVACRDAATAV